MINQKDHLNRRKRLAMAMAENSIAFIPAATDVLRNGDTHYRFRQNSDFYYLTGFAEPDAMLVLCSGANAQSFLFNRSRNPDEEQWTGKRLGQQGALDDLGVDEAWPIETLKNKAGELIIGKSAIYFAMGCHDQLEELLSQALKDVKHQIRRGVEAPRTLHDLTPLLGDMRLFKDENEIECIRKAARVSMDAHKRAMRRCKDMTFEYQLEAELIHEFYRQGCRSTAYEPIVGAGANACILHYTENNQALRKGDLVLIDAGAEYENYAADITRTFPVNGHYNTEQSAIYTLVLKAQKAGIAKIKPGIVWNEVQQVIVEILTEGLCRLGLLEGEVNNLIANGAYRKFYTHNSGHWLGLDVHDCGTYKTGNEWRKFEPGMVLTVEPGLYISAQMEGIDEKWQDIGVRIEDDILVTEDGHENLTRALPVDIEDIEALMRE